MTALEALTPILVSLAFAGGLIPSIASANKIAFATLLEQRPELSARTLGQELRDAVRAALARGQVPVIHGDVVPDEASRASTAPRPVSILSGDVILHHLALTLAASAAASRSPPQARGNQRSDR